LAKLTDFATFLQRGFLSSPDEVLNRALFPSYTGAAFVCQGAELFRFIDKLPRKSTTSLFTTIWEGPSGLWVAVSFATVLMGSLFLVRINADVNWDGVVFIAAAKNYTYYGFREGFAVWPKFPAYPLLISLVHGLIPDWVAAGRVISLFSIVIVVAGIYRIAHDLFGRNAALLSAMAFALIPEAVLQSNSINRDPVFLAAFIWATYFLQRSLVTRTLFHFSFGLALVLVSCLFRGEGVVLLAVYPVTLFVMVRKGGYALNPYARFLRVFIFSVLALTLLLSALAISHSSFFAQIAGAFSDYYNLKISDSYVRISSQLQLINDTTPATDVGVHFGSEAKSLIPLIFGLSLIHILAGMLFFTNSIFLAIGIKTAHWSDSAKFVVATALAYLSILYLYFFWFDLMMTRWVLPVAALACLWVGAGLNRSLEYVGRWRYSAILITCILVALAVNAGIAIDKFFKKDDSLAKIAGGWIAKQRHFSKANTVFNDPVVAFYAGMDPFSNSGPQARLYLREDKNFAEVEDFARKHGADFVVLYVRSSRVKDLAPFTSFSKMYETENGSRKIIIYCSPRKLLEIEFK
jgi:hypothetical protein